MDQFLEVLRQAAVFMVAAKVILHFFPGNKYDRYGKMMVALTVLSILVVPVLGFFQKDMERTFWEEADRLEAENEMFTKKLEAFSAGQESVVENGLVLSVEEKVREAAQEAGVSVKDVRIDGKTVVIGVTATATERGQKGGVEPVKVEPVTLGEEAGASLAAATSGTNREPVMPGEADAARAGAGAQNGRRRQDLAGIFAEELGMEEGRVEVIER